jgi:uncharacterized membrane protein HdeD (DUF308 family)
VLVSGNNRRMLANFIGIYWLLSAILTIRWALTVRWNRGSRLGLVAGIVGVVAASLMLLRRPLENVVSFGTLVVMLGIAAVLTGSLRLLGAFEVERRTGRRWTFGGLALGTVEVLLGVLLFFAREGNLRLITLVVAIWGFVGGSVLILEGLGLRRMARAGDPGG